MNYMFYGATAFNQDIGKWPIRRDCHIMEWMFYQVCQLKHLQEFMATKLRNISTWNVSQVKMQFGNHAFNQISGNGMCAVTLMSGLDRRNIEGTLSTPEEELRRILDSEGTGREIVSFLGGSKN